MDYANHGNRRAQQLVKEQMAASKERAPERNKDPEESGASETQLTRSLRNLGYGEIYQWLVYKANRQGKAPLLGFFDGLTVLQQIEAIKKMAGTTGKPSLDVFTDKMSTRNNMLFKKTVDWDKFSVACREAKKLRTDDVTADTAGDYAGYAATGGSVALSAGDKLANMAVGAGDVTKGLAQTGAGLSALGAAVQAYQAYDQHSSSLSAFDAVHNIGTEGVAGMADLTRYTAQAASPGSAVGEAVASGAATAVAGAAAIIGGAVYLAGGVAGYRMHDKREKNLSLLQTEADVKDDPMLSRAASIGGETQALNRTKSAATAAKGAAMIVGGALLLAGGPVGWIMIGVAGAISGAAAIYKFLKNRQRREEVVDRYIDLKGHMIASDFKDKDKRSASREKLLGEHGFNSISQCYTQIIAELAFGIYEKAVKGDDPEYRTLLENIGLVVNRKKGEPKPELIAKKLSG
ncbi:hypothetical protein PAESOLCIP111_03988 [Paenibacillus solanacearum]|uniref:Uncharacterized protein n=1 Tax=Paenibacillus solanacearum TaxID=2048548 RepID=A0A916K3H7_9BACL|nr:hypothetical protein PAESOLCIP111_03988 [Paenibacillus solanacearum]